MRIAVLLDVHGNLRALEAVTDDLRRQAPDLVVHGGDLALNGPRPAEVVDHIRELGWPGARGNADQLLWAGLDPVPAAEREHARALRQATLRLLGPDRVQWLRQLPRLWRHEDLVVMHASPTTVEEAPPSRRPTGSLSRPTVGWPPAWWSMPICIDRLSAASAP